MMDWLVEFSFLEEPPGSVFAHDSGFGRKDSQARRDLNNGRHWTWRTVEGVPQAIRVGGGDRGEDI